MSKFGYAAAGLLGAGVGAIGALAYSKNKEKSSENEETTNVEKVANEEDFEEELDEGLDEDIQEDVQEEASTEDAE